MDLSTAAWRKSSYSGSQTDCVEVARASGLVAVRDSKRPDDVALVFSVEEWACFLREVGK
ncbi:DUF397 domain-containing protein [Salinactinospora qingdaonensis]